MDKNSVRSAIIYFEKAVIKELYKNKKIGDQEYTKVVNKLDKELETIIIDKKLVPLVIDIKI